MPIYNLVYGIQTAPGPTPILPTEYQEVEYIQSNGKCRIDTGYISNSSTYAKYEFKFNFVSFASDDSDAIPYVFGNVPNGQNYFCSSVDKTQFQIGAGNDDLLFGSLNSDTDYTISEILNNGNMSCVVNGITYTSTYSGILDTIHQVPLFCRYRRLSIGYNFYATNMKLYYFKIFSSDNTIERDFVPCYRKSDSTIGLRDCVNKVFYTNAGPGTFIKGPDAN